MLYLVNCGFIIIFFSFTEEVILAEERTTEEEKLHIMEARRRAAKKKKLKKMGKSKSTDTEEEEQEEDMADDGEPLIFFTTHVNAQMASHFPQYLNVIYLFYSSLFLIQPYIPVLIGCNLSVYYILLYEFSLLSM